MAKSDKPTKAVISVFVSRFDRVCNDMCVATPKDNIGAINATKCYFEVQKFDNKHIRTLFASTGVKQEYLSKDYYIQKLLYPHSINTAPLEAINSFDLDNFKLPLDIISENECDRFINNLETDNIDINKLSEMLLKNGLDDFKNSFEQLLNFINKEKDG